jgi:biofilm PGA synthesis N-glycosyltransferase PgaC
MKGSIYFRQFVSSLPWNSTSVAHPTLTGIKGRPRAAAKKKDPEVTRLRKVFATSTLIAFSYSAICLYISRGWILDLADIFGLFLSVLIILFIAIIPGYLNIFLLTTLFFFRSKSINLKKIKFPKINVLIAAYNEEDVLLETIRGIQLQDYPNSMDIIIVDDGSSDRTVEIVKSVKRKSHFLLNPEHQRFKSSPEGWKIKRMRNIKVIEAKHGGKSHALNTGVKYCEHDIIVTIDADTFLYKNAVQQIVACLMSDSRYAAVAGHVLAKNERSCFLSRLQAWDYQCGISSVKRQQGMFHGTLVAQGAFSAFRKRRLREVGGWQDRLGEDIVLTWALISKGYRIGYEPAAFAFTNVPTSLDGFNRQRQRWSRGMIEGLKEHFDIIWSNKGFSSFFIGVDFLFPIIDAFYTFVFLPGVIMAFFGIWYIAGPMTLLVFPIQIAIIIKMILSQKKFMEAAGLRIRRNYRGLFFYGMIYQIIHSPICLLGYFKEITRFKRKW